MKIVVDAMGGDHAPKAIVGGVVDAVNELGVNVVLIGVRGEVEKELSLYNYPKDKIEVFHATDVIGMEEPATVSIRKKRNSSISLGINLLKEPEYNAFISAGNTGAVVAASTINLGMMPGVERSGIGLVIPTVKRFSFIIDVGANPDPKPQHLLQSGLMSRVYVREVFDIENPSVGLLNIGEEASKGLVR